MRFLLWSLLLAFSHPLYAANNMLFSGTLIEPPPCKINEGGIVDIDFGDKIGVNKVDGVNYLKTLDYLVTCEAAINGTGVTLTLSGKQAIYDNATIQTDVPDLGIRVLQNGQPFILDKPVVINSKAPPTLQAVPVKTPGASLKEGAFMATATLKADYQ